jgi:hypothetical protein
MVHEEIYSVYFGALGQILPARASRQALFLLACCYFSEMAYILPLFGHPTSRPARSHDLA